MTEVIKPKWWKLKPFYFFNSEVVAPETALPMRAKGIIIPIFSGGIFFIRVPWSRWPYIRFVDWNGRLDIPGPPENLVGMQRKIRWGR